MGVKCCGCDLNPGPSAPESSMLTTRLPSYPILTLTADISLLSVFWYHKDWSVVFARLHQCNTWLVYYFVSAAVTVDSSHMTVSSSALWSRFSPSSNFVNGHVSTMWFMVSCWPQSQEGDWARPHLCKFAQQGLDLSGNGSSETVYDEGNRNRAVG